MRESMLKGTFKPRLLYRKKEQAQDKHNGKIQRKEAQCIIIFCSNMEVQFILDRSNIIIYIQFPEIIKVIMNIYWNFHNFL